MCYLRCSGCGYEVEQPTLRETLSGVYVCPSCGKDYSDYLDKEGAFSELLDRIEVMEETLKEKVK
jgi:DNA-directed RNA polymerase subunit RPC12/RpoP